MALTPLNALVLLIAGTLTGVLGAILGIGGGVLLIPILLIGFDLPMHHAVASSIVSVIATSTAVASTNVERGTANMRLGMTLEIATALGAIAGGLTAGVLHPRTLDGHSHRARPSVAIGLGPAARLALRGAGARRRRTTGDQPVTRRRLTGGGENRTILSGAPKHATISHFSSLSVERRTALCHCSKWRQSRISLSPGPTIRTPPPPWCTMPILASACCD